MNSAEDSIFVQMDLTSTLHPSTLPTTTLWLSPTTSDPTTTIGGLLEVTDNITVFTEDRCQYLEVDFDITTAIICGMYLVFGVVYTLYGYRCFKAVLFLTGFIFGSVVVYTICMEETLLPTGGTVGIALVAGLLYGLVTMLVQYVGLFMTGFHLGLFSGFAGLLIVNPWYHSDNVWIIVGLLLGSAVIAGIITLFMPKAFTILGTSMYGGVILAVSLDYFIERFLMVYWAWEKLRVAPPPHLSEATEKAEEPCWFSWMILSVWPTMVIVGILTQWKVTGKGTHHRQMMPSRTSRQVNLLRIRQEETKAEQRQRKYRYLYQVRTAHGDVISQYLPLSPAINNQLFV